MHSESVRSARAQPASITWHYDATGNGTTDGSDPVYHFCYDGKWRIVGTWRGTDTDPKELFIYHNAGVAGMGGSSYIDSVVLRDRDMNGGGGWTGASDGTLEARHYYAQNWRADVSAIFDNSGAVMEWQKYSAYGVPFLLTPGDHNKDGVVDSDDVKAFEEDFKVTNLRADLNKDGVVNSADQTLFTASYTKAAPGGRWKLSASDVRNRKGYAGYEHEGFGNDLAAPELAHVRNRVLHFGLGRWTRRDPAGYVDGNSLYQIAGSRPIISLDPLGPTTIEQCNRWLAECLQLDPDVERVRQTCPGVFIGRSFCADNTTDPRTCRDNNGGAYHCATNEITICTENISRMRHVRRALAHELRHACDEMKLGRCALRNCEARACSEIRPYATSGQCCHLSGWREDDETYDGCVRRLAKNSLEGPCDPRLVDEVWHRCFCGNGITREEWPACADGPYPQYPGIETNPCFVGPPSPQPTPGGKGYGVIVLPH